MGRLLLIGLIVGGAMMFFGYQNWTIQSGCKEPPAVVKLADLTQKGADGNLNVKVTDALPADDFVYSTGKRGGWKYVYIPLLTPEMKVAGLVKSTRLKSEQEVATFALGLVSGGVTGIVTNDIGSMSSSERSKFESAHPGVDFKSLPIVEEGKRVPSGGEVYGLLGGGLVVFLGSAGGSLVAFKKSRG